MPDPNKFFYVRWVTLFTPYRDFYLGGAPTVARQVEMPSLSADQRPPEAPPKATVDERPRKPRFQPFSARKIRDAAQPIYSFSLVRVFGLPGKIKASELFFWNEPEPRFWNRNCFDLLCWISLEGQRMGDNVITHFDKEPADNAGWMSFKHPDLPKITVTYREPGKYEVVISPILLNLLKTYGQQADPPFIMYDPNTGVIRRIFRNKTIFYTAKLKGWRMPFRFDRWWYDEYTLEGTSQRPWVWVPPRGSFGFAPMKRGEPLYPLVYAEESGTIALLSPHDARVLFQRSLNMPIECPEVTFDEERGEGYIVLIPRYGQSRAVVFDRFGREVVRLQLPQAIPGRSLSISNVQPVYHEGKRFWYARAGSAYILMWDEENRLVQWLDPEGTPGRPGRVKPGEYLIPVWLNKGGYLLLDTTGSVVGRIKSSLFPGLFPLSPLDFDGDGVHEWVYQNGNILFILSPEGELSIYPPVITLPEKWSSAFTIRPLRTRLPIPMEHITFIPLGDSALLLCSESRSSRKDKKQCVFIPDVLRSNQEEVKVFPRGLLQPFYDVSGDGLRDFFSVAYNDDRTAITVTLSDLNDRVILQKTFAVREHFPLVVQPYKYRGSLFLSVPGDDRPWSSPARESLLLDKANGNDKPPPFNVIEEVAVMRGARIFKAYRTSFTQAVLEMDLETRVPFTTRSTISSRKESGGSADLVFFDGKAYLSDSFGTVILALASDKYNLAQGYGRIIDRRICFRETLPTPQNPRFIAFVCRVLALPKDIRPTVMSLAQLLTSERELNLLVLVGEGKIRAGLYETEGSLSGIMLVGEDRDRFPEIVGVTTSLRGEELYAALVRLPLPPVVYSED